MLGTLVILGSQLGGVYAVWVAPVAAWRNGRMGSPDHLYIVLRAFCNMILFSRETCGTSVRYSCSSCMRRKSIGGASPAEEHARLLYFTS